MGSIGFKLRPPRDCLTGAGFSLNVGDDAAAAGTETVGGVAGVVGLVDVAGTAGGVTSGFGASSKALTAATSSGFRAAAVALSLRPLTITS